MAEGALTFFKILKPYSFHIEGVPFHLTAMIVCMTMKCRNNATETKCHGFLAKGALFKGHAESTHNVITETYVRSKILK